MRRRLPLSLVVVAAVAAATGVGLMSDVANSDFAPFAAAGGTLASAHWLHTYHDPFVQGGPFELLLALVAKTLGGRGSGASVVLDVIGMLALLAVTYTAVARRAQEAAFVAAAALGLFVIRDLGTDAHSAEIGIALLWFLAARDARAGRIARAGILVGLSAGFETWGVLGVTTLLLVPHLREAVRAGAVAASVAAALYAPFLAGGDFHMLALHWRTTHGFVGHVVGVGRPFTWRMRFVQATLVVALGGALARRLRRSAQAVWLVPAATSLLRLLFDPVRYGYYWDTSLTLLVLGLAPWTVAPQALAQALRSWLEQRLGRAALARQ